MNNLIPVSQAAQLLKIHKNTLYKKIKENRIGHIRLGKCIYFTQDMIDKYLKIQSTEAKNDTNLLPSENKELDTTSLILYDQKYLKGSPAMAEKARRWRYGHGIVYKRGKSWGIEYQDETGKRFQRIVKNAQTRKDAVIVLNRKVEEIFNRTYDVKKTERIRLDQFGEKYLENYAKVNKRSWKTDSWLLENLKHYFKDKFLDEIGSWEIEQLKKKLLDRNMRKASVNRHLALLRKMLNLAKEWEYLRSVPKMKLFSEKDNLKERILTELEENELLRELSGQLRSIVIVALNTGARLGEVLSLEWGHVDFNNERILLEKTKSGKSREIPINQTLMIELEKMQVLNGKSPYLFFNPGTGKPFMNVRKGFIAACDRASIEGLRFHDLRHTFASRLVKKGVDIITVKELLGHSSVRITERYTHSSWEQKKKAASALEGICDGYVTNLERIEDLPLENNVRSH